MVHSNIVYYLVKEVAELLIYTTKDKSQKLLLSKIIQTQGYTLYDSIYIKLSKTNLIYSSRMHISGCLSWGVKWEMMIIETQELSKVTKMFYILTVVMVT